MWAASQRPRRPATTVNRTGWPTAMVREPSAIAVQWKGSTAPSSARDLAEPARVVEGLDDPGDRGVRRRGHQWTIFDRGSSMMSDAPASLSAGMSVLISDLATTVSTA